MVVRVEDNQLISGHLYKLGADNNLRRCVMEHESPIILAKSHEGIVRGHYAWKDILHRIVVAHSSHRCK
jgi:hypothetical protein